MAFLIKDTFKKNRQYFLYIENDDRVVYGYLLYKKIIIGDVWLYNLIEPPIPYIWENEQMPFLNPKEYFEVRSSNIPTERDFKFIWTEHSSELIKVEIHIHGSLFGIIESGSKPGWSMWSIKNGR